MTYLAIDPSLCNTGWVVVHSWDIVVDHGVIATKPQRKAGSRAKDNSRRVAEIYRQLRVKMVEYDVGRIFSEQPSGGSKSAKANTAMGLASAVVSCLATQYDVPLEIVTARQTKESLTGDPNASKGEMMRHAAMIYPAVAKQYPSRKAGKPYADKFEHVADAIAAYWYARGHRWLHSHLVCSSGGC